MQLESLACNNCGAPLEVPSTAQFVRCNHCGTQLTIRRDASVTYTEKIDQIATQTETIAGHLAELRYQGALESVDRQWERDRERYLVSNKNGVKSEPSVVGSVIFGAIATVMGIGAMASGAGSFGLIFVAVGVIGAVMGLFASQRYSRAEREYRQQRNRLSISDFRVSPDRQTSATGDLESFDPSRDRTATFLKDLEEDQSDDGPSAVSQSVESQSAGSQPAGRLSVDAANDRRNS